MTIWEIAIIVLVVNLPFGYWRANVRKFSWQWFLAVHLPVGLVILLRIVSGLGWQIATIPVLFAAFLVGQFLGTKLHRWWSKDARVPVTSCLVMDAMRMLQAGR
ncbi:MAG: hypothetical protein Q8R28_12920 [Dehalococcoidia bacterium]|nr:hypothetical protein [Dehalococcoidia bacterium]